VTVAKSIALFVVAALFEIGGAWLVWQGVRENRGWGWAGVGVAARSSCTRRAPTDASP
jgi:small multidrug resistance family-3 protein